MRRAQALLWGYVAVVILVGTVAVRSVRDRLPDPVASHWDARGEVDGFTTITGMLWQTPLIIAGITALSSGLLLWWQKAPRSQLTAVGVGTAHIVGALLYGGVVEQQGLTHARQAATFPVSTVMIALLCLPLGLAVWLLLRRNDPLPEAVVAETVPTLDVPTGARLAWSGRTRPAPLMMVVLALSWLAAIVIILTMQAPWWLLIVVTLAGLLPLTMFWSTVTVGSTGLTVKALNLVPLQRISLREVESAQSAEVSALKDCGGWGYRFGRDGSVGIVTSSGGVLRVNRRGNRPWIVTVDDADDAAAALNTLVQRAGTAG